MKIGIVTQPLVNNYGGLLQNFALQNVLKKMGHEPITIDQKVFPPDNLITFIVENLSVLIHNIVYLFIPNKKALEIPYIRKRRLSQTLPKNTDFINKYINRTAKVFGIKNTRKISSALNLDAYIVGSDQVWRKGMNSRMFNNFLDFTEGWNVKRIAYAASFGTDDWQYNAKETSMIKGLIKQFDAVSVREKSGIELCKSYLDTNAICVLDPTLLLTATEYDNLLDIQRCDEHQYLFSYLLDISNEKVAFVRSNANNIGVDCRICSVNNLGYAHSPSVQEWLANIKNANCVICDSFHGMVFSILYHKKFIVISNKARGNTRFVSLLGQLNLEYRLIDERLLEKSYSILSKEIDWTAVDCKLESLRVNSLKFIISNL